MEKDRKKYKNRPPAKKEPKPPVTVPEEVQVVVSDEPNPHDG